MRDLFYLEKEWLYNYPGHWKMSRLKDHTYTNTGITFTKADLVDEGNPVLSYGQVHAKNNPRTQINHKLIKFIPDSLVEDKSSAKVKVGDYIFADTSEDLDGCGNSIYVNEDVDLYAGYHTILLRNESLKCGKYYAYLFMSDQWRSQIRKKVKSVKLYSISQGILNQTFIVIPPIAEQEAIAAYLDKECEKIGREIKLLERKADGYRRLRRSLINRAVTRGLNANAQMKPSGNGWIGNIPRHWDIARNKNIFIEHNETVGKSKDHQLLSLTLNGIIVRDMEGGGKFPAEFDNYKIVEPGNLIFCLFDIDETPRTIGLSKHHGMITGAYDVFSAKENLVINEWGYYFYLNIDYQKSLKPFYTGLRKVVKAQNFANIHIPIPPISEQREIVAYLDEKCGKIDAIVEKIETKIERLKELKRSLINEVVTGQRAINASEL